MRTGKKEITTIHLTPEEARHAICDFVDKHYSTIPGHDESFKVPRNFQKEDYDRKLKRLKRAKRPASKPVETSVKPWTSIKHTNGVDVIITSIVPDDLDYGVLSKNKDGKFNAEVIIDECPDCGEDEKYCECDEIRDDLV